MKRYWLSILLFSFILSAAVYSLLFSEQLPSGLLAIRSAEIFGFLALGFLYLALLASPLYKVFPTLSGKQFYRSCVPPLGVAAFYFAIIHARITFFTLLLGFKGLPFLGGLYLTAVIFGFITLIILFILSLFSLPWLQRKAGRAWKWIRKLSYIAGLSILLHVVTVGSDFRNFSNPYSLITISLVAALLVLYAVASYEYLVKKFPHVPSYLFSLGISIIFFMLFYIVYAIHSTLHAAHLH